MKHLALKTYENVSVTEEKNAVSYVGYESEGKIVIYKKMSDFSDVRMSEDIRSLSFF